MPMISLTDIRDNLQGGPLSYPAFRRVLAARFVSGLGSWMQTVAAGYVVFKLTGNAMEVGLLAAIALGPSLVGAPVGGALADRFCPRRLTTGFSFLEALPPLALALIAFEGELTVPIIYGCVFALAAIHSVNQPILQIVIPFTVPERLRHQAVADVSAVYNVAQLSGAILGGAAVQFVGAGTAFMANSASYVLVGVILISSPILQRSCDLARHRNDDREMEVRARDGWKLEIVRVVGLGAAAFFLLVAPIEQLMPAIAAAHGEDAMYLGVLLAALCFGAVLAGPLVRRMATDGDGAQRTLILGVLLCGPLIFLLGLSGSLLSDLLLLMAVGVCWEMIFVSGGSSLQLDVPEQIKGRMVGLFYVLVSGCAALGGLLMGFLFDSIGIEDSFFAVGILVLVTGIVLRLRHSLSPGSPSPPVSLGRDGSSQLSSSTNSDPSESDI